MRERASTSTPPRACCPRRSSAAEVKDWTCDHILNELEIGITAAWRARERVQTADLTRSSYIDTGSPWLTASRSHCSADRDRSAHSGRARPPDDLVIEEQQGTLPEHMARTLCVRQARVIEAGCDTFGAKRVPVCDGLIAECTVRRGRPGARGRSPRAASRPGSVSADIGDGRIFTVIGVPTARLLTTPFRGESSVLHWGAGLAGCGRL
jgi:hypothetical protein